MKKKYLIFVIFTLVWLLTSCSTKSAEVLENIPTVTEELNESAIAKEKNFNLSDNCTRSLSGGILTDVEILDYRSISARKARIMRINTGTYEFEGLMCIERTKEIFLVNKALITKAVKESVSKASSYYLFKKNEEGEIVELKKYDSVLSYPPRK